jgi:hypothetical protein
MFAAPKWLVRAVSICGGWWAVMSGAVSVALAFLALTSEGSPKSFYAILAFLALWACMVQMGMANYAMLEKQRPKFKILCGAGIPGCVVDRPGNNTRYLRLLVKTDCITTVHKCRGYLSKIEKGRLVLFDDDRRDLPFAPSDAADSLEKTIFPNTPYHLDILAIAGGNVYICVKGGMPALSAGGKPVFQECGEYLLTVGVCGENVSTQFAKLKFSVKDNWTENTLEMV